MNHNHFNLKKNPLLFQRCIFSEVSNGNEHYEFTRLK